MKLVKFLIVGLMMTASLCFAKPINLFEQPKSDAKIVGSVNSDDGIILIFTPKDGSNWTKVADPKNGNVGWVKQADLKSAGFTVTQQIVDTGNGTHGYQVTGFGGVQTMSPEQTQAMLKRLNDAQQAAQKAWQDMIGSFTKLNLPVVVPVVVMPEKNNSTNNK